MSRGNRAGAPAIPAPQELGNDGRAVAVGLGAGCLLLQALPETVRLALRYERAAVLDGELWRLITGHLVHAGWSHALLNVAALVLLAALAPPSPALRGARLVARLAFVAAGIGLALVLTPGIDWYVGLSGILHGLAVALAAAVWPHSPWTATGIGAAIAGKLLVEQIYGGSVAMEQLIGVPVVARAHLYGAGAALLAVILRAAVGGFPHRPGRLKAPRQKR